MKKDRIKCEVPENDNNFDFPGMLDYLYDKEYLDDDSGIENVALRKSNVFYLNYLTLFNKEQDTSGINAFLNLRAACRDMVNFSSDLSGKLLSANEMFSSEDRGTIFVVDPFSETYIKSTVNVFYGDSIGLIPTVSKVVSLGYLYLGEQNYLIYFYLFPKSDYCFLSVEEKTDTLIRTKAAIRLDSSELCGRTIESFNKEINLKPGLKNPLELVMERGYPGQEIIKAFENLIDV
jgi:hypothetical protein